MKIAINTRHLTNKGIDGIGRFTFETFKIIVEQHPDVEFLFLFDRAHSSQYVSSVNIKPIIVYPPTVHPWLIDFWYNYSLPFIFTKHKPDLFVSTDGLLSLRTKTKQLAVIHDLNFVHYHDKSSKYNDFFLNFYPKSAAIAKRIATVSEYSKQDIIEHYKIDENKIDVVCNGVSAAYFPIDDDKKRQVKIKLTKGCDYFIFVGSLYERKNIKRLLEAFEKFKTDNGTNHKLVLAGRKRWTLSEMEVFYNGMRFKDDIIFTGRLSDEELCKVLGAATALTYVSLFEGFGIPILEAFHCDVPVITSNTTSMPEVAGAAAILVNPLDVEEIATAMQGMIADEALRIGLIEKGRVQREKYSWQLSADLLWKSIEKCF
ncbi:MAG: glycosyltransferase family 1 protein [Bacteroidia bacterium]